MIGEIPQERDILCNVLIMDYELWNLNKYFRWKVRWKYKIYKKNIYIFRFLRRFVFYLYEYAYSDYAVWTYMLTKIFYANILSLGKNKKRGLWWCDLLEEDTFFFGTWKMKCYNDMVQYRGISSGFNSE